MQTKPEKAAFGISLLGLPALCDEGFSASLRRDTVTRPDQRASRIFYIFFRFAGL
jgi:hypothetical protein